MKLEEQVVCLELAKELKGEKYSQKNSFLIWRRPLEPYRTIMNIEHDLIEYNANTWSELKLRELAEYWYAAPTVAELGEKLLRGYLTVYGGQHWQCFKIIDIRSCPIDFEQIDITAATEADARAKCWLYLKKKGLIK